MNWLESTGLDVKIAQIVLHKADEPNTVGDLLNTQKLAGKHGADVDFTTFVADTTAVRDQRCSVMKRIFEIPQAFVGPGGFFVELRWHLHVQRLVWPVLVVILDEVVEAGLLGQEVLGGGLGGFFLER